MFGPPKLRRSKRLLVALIAGGCLAAAVLVYQFHRQQLTSVREEQSRALEAIADIKTQAIANWRREHLADGQALSANTVLARFVRTYVGAPTPSAERELRSWFQQLKTAYDYSTVLLFDVLGRPRLSSEAGPLDQRAESLAVDAIRQKKVLFEDFRRHDNGSIHLAVFAPLLDERGQPAGAVKLQIDPARFLYAHIQTWPTPSRSSETLLVRREGNDVVYLNELRHRKDTAPKLRFSAASAELPAARAVSGYEGAFEGRDYRGVPVLAAVRRVPDSPWFLVAKTDRAEAYSALTGRTWYFALVTGLVLVLSGGGLMLAWSRRESDHYRQLYDAETQRRALVSHYEHLHRYANDIILLLDESGRIVEANERGIETYGYPRAKLFGLHIRDLRDPSALAQFEEQWRATESQNGIVFETLHRRADGSVLPVEVSSRAIRVDGKPFRQHIVRDITERKRAEQALRESQADLNRAQAVAHAGSWRLDVRRNELLWSDETYQMFEIPKDRPLTYETFLSFVHPADREFVDRSWQAALRGETYDIEHRIVVAGAVKWVRERAELEFDSGGALLGGFGTVQDITSLKQAQEEIRLLNAELEQRVRQRTTLLEAANQELEAFAYSVSHDLRAPLRGIDGWSLALLEDYGGQLDARARQYLDRVRHETQLMGRLIDDLLQLSRVTRVEMQLDPVDLTSLAEGVAAKLRDAHPERKLEFEIQQGLSATADARLLEIALTNLMGNAVKFTAPRAQARIEFCGSERNGEPAFSVRDNGVGFDMEYASMLFGAFQRLHKASEFPGTGIGLATVQRVIHRHGGRVWAEAQPDQGATFYFTLGATK